MIQPAPAPQDPETPQASQAPQASQTVLVHIGKCGGATLRDALERSDTRIDSITHVHQPPLGPQYRYYITLRCPIARAISAFYWRRTLVLIEASQEHRLPGEAQILRHYGSLDALAQALYHPDGSRNALAQGHYRSILHLSEDIAFYLRDLLAVSQPDQILGILRQESLAADMLQHFGIENPGRVNDNRHHTSAEERQLSPKGEANLRRFLQADFDCIAKLRDWGKLPADAPAPL
ncbi:hypothetical protein [Pseudophaeobacter arcticus]|jgi:hypothetical protein|uniref:hypothetical protein n=1 Tax=Pseudophaeobacter arcticus TaxID=385492 RepID=UPI002491E506|nr:hypothetical protein [Pseudophaeobacter arcticus]